MLERENFVSQSNVCEYNIIYYGLEKYLDLKL